MCFSNRNRTTVIMFPQLYFLEKKMIVGLGDLGVFVFFNKAPFNM